MRQAVELGGVQPGSVLHYHQVELGVVGVGGVGDVRQRAGVLHYDALAQVVRAVCLQAGSPERQRAVVVVGRSPAAKKSKRLKIQKIGGS